MRYTRHQADRLISEQEAAQKPTHVHQSMVYVGPDDDAEALLAAAQEGCRLSGCVCTTMVVPKWKPVDELQPGEWAALVREDSALWADF